MGIRRRYICIYTRIYIKACARRDGGGGRGQWAGKVKGSSVRRWLSLNELV